MEIPADRQKKILTDLGFIVKGDKAHVPAWRPDVLGDADLVEEIARVASLANLQGIPLPPWWPLMTLNFSDHCHFQSQFQDQAKIDQSCILLVCC